MLGPVLWDFSSLSLSFKIGGNEFLLKGLPVSASKVVGPNQAAKELQNARTTYFLQLLGVEKVTRPMVAQPQIQHLLDAYADIFMEPQGLPPPRSHDHRIPLIEGTKPVNVRPYMHPYFQKSEIEKTVNDMLKSGVIRSSVSPFSSPVLLGKKRIDPEECV